MSCLSRSRTSASLVSLSGSMRGNFAVASSARNRILSYVFLAGHVVTLPRYWLVICDGFPVPQQKDQALDSPGNFNTSDFFAEHWKSRFEKVRTDIATRLRRVCSDLPEEEFLSLVDKMARAQMRGETL